MPTFYVEDYDGDREDDAAAEAKVVETAKVEDKTVKPKRTGRKG